MFKEKIKGFIAGTVITAILMASPFSMAQSIKKNIEAVFNSVNLKVNGKTVQADNILYDGTTYVPLRTIADMLGKEVGWDEATNTASINDKNSNTATTTQPQVPATNYEYMVKDATGKALYSFKINKITNMSERNQYSDKKSAQVILIDYTYKNIANAEDVYLSDIYFKVVDSGGKIGYTYPNSKKSYPQPVPVGVTCDAQMIFGLDNLSSTITLNYYENAFGSMTTSFTIPIK